MRRIGILIARGEQDPEGQRQAVAFDSGLRAMGWLPGRNIQIDYRWQTDPRQRTAVVNELMSLKADLLVINSTPYLSAVRAAAYPHPVVFVAIADPVAQGFVDSLARPGWTMTGLGAEEPSMGAKWAELLKEIAPETRSITAIFNLAASPFSRMFLPSIETLLQLGGSELLVAQVRDESGIEEAIATAGRRPSSGVIVLPESFLASRRDLVAVTVARHRLPAIYSVAPYVQSGGLMAYGIDRADLFRRGPRS
jgi:putative ABC transport system substrate-binding protein